jgi:hypothetical protein
MRTIRFTILSILLLLAMAIPASAAECATCTVISFSWSPGFSTGGDGGTTYTMADCTPTYISGKTGIQNCQVVTVDANTQTCTGSTRVSECYEYPPVCSPWDPCGGILASAPEQHSLIRPVLLGL